MVTPLSTSSRMSRRALVGASLASAALLPLGSAYRAAAGPATAATWSIARRQETAASPAGWRTWYLSSPDELRPAAPSAPSQAEIEEMAAKLQQGGGPKLPGLGGLPGFNPFKK